MTIFKLNLRSTDNGASSEDKKDEKPVASEAPAEADQSGAAAVSKEAEASFSLTPTGQEESKLLIKIDGAAGRMFTEALNRVLAQENASMQAVAETMQDNAELLEQTYPKHRLLHVKVVDGRTVAMPEVITIQNEVLKEDADGYIVAVEGANFGRHSEMKMYSVLQHLEVDKKVKVSLSMESAVQYTADCIRRLS